MSKAILARQTKGQFQLTITIPHLAIKEQYQKELAKTKDNIEIPGFRKGKAPMTKVEKKVDQEKIYEQAIQQLLPEAYTSALKEHNLKPIISPQIELIDAQPDKDWQIRATSAEKPEIKLENYKNNIKGLLKTTQIWTPENQNQTTDNKQPKSPETPTHDQKLSQIAQWLLKNIEASPADIIVQQHANHLLSQLLEQVQKLGVTLDQYLASTNKKIEDLKAEYAKRAQEDLSLEFILMEIGLNEKITVSDQEINQLIETAPDPKIKENLNQPEQKQQLASVIFRQKTFEHLMKLAI